MNHILHESTPKGDSHVHRRRHSRNYSRHRAHRLFASQSLSRQWTVPRAPPEFLGGFGQRRVLMGRVRPIELQAWRKARSIERAISRGSSGQLASSESTLARAARAYLTQLRDTAVGVYGTVHDGSATV